MDNIFEVEVCDASHNVVKKCEVKNILTYEGLLYTYNLMFRGGPQHTEWYIGAFNVDFDIRAGGGDDPFETLSNHSWFEYPGYFGNTSRQRFFTSTATPDNLLIHNIVTPITLQFGPVNLGGPDNLATVSAGLFVTNDPTIRSYNGVLLAEALFRNLDMIIAPGDYVRINYSFRA